MNLIGEFVKSKRKQLGFTQEDLAENAGVALIGIRKIEQGKDNLSLTKVNHVLMLFMRQKNHLFCLIAWMKWRFWQKNLYSIPSPCKECSRNYLLVG